MWLVVSTVVEGPQTSVILVFVTTSSGACSALRGSLILVSTLSPPSGSLVTVVVIFSPCGPLLVTTSPPGNSFTLVSRGIEGVVVVSTLISGLRGSKVRYVGAHTSVGRHTVVAHTSVGRHVVVVVRGVAPRTSLDKSISTSRSY